MAWGDLPAEARTLDPLGDNLRHGLTAVAVLAFISFFSASILFFYLVYKLTTWSLFIKSQSDGQFHQQSGSIQRAIDVTLGIDGIFSDSNGEAGKKADGDAGPRQPNQFLVLIINLLLADMHQGVAFLLNAAWLRYDAILVDTATCYTQGLFVSLGDLASSMFITAIAIHTYMAVVRGIQTPQKVLYGVIVAIWMFVYAISFIPIATTRNGAEFGGFFVRAGSWCWMNRKYENLRLFTHYLYIFLGLGTTSILYIIIFFHIRRQARVGASNGENDGDSVELQLNRNPAFLIYPVIYVLCTLPLAAGRIATMAGANVPNGYFCFAGAMIASNGSFDCLLFGTTRNTIIFASRYDIASNDVGLKTFAFLKTPTNRKFGNTISIQGGRQHDEVPATGGWWTWPAKGAGSSNRSHRGMTRTTSQESLRGPAIQMDTVTSVVVEVDDGVERDPRYPDTSTSSNPSLRSADKDFVRIAERTQESEIGLHLCRTYARWAEVDLWIDRGISNFARSKFDYALFDIWNLLGDTAEAYEPIKLRKEWLETVGQRRNKTGKKSDFKQDSIWDKAIDVADEIRTREPYFSAEVSGSSLQMAIAVHLADILSRMGPDYLDRKGIRVLDDDDGKSPEPDDPIVEHEFFLGGYGYSIRSSSTIPLALAILLLHIAVVLIHAMVILFSRHRWLSSCWGSFGEILILALCSGKHDLGNVGGGVDSSRTWSTPAVVRVVGNEGKLEMILRQGDTDELIKRDGYVGEEGIGNGYTRVEPGIKYR
ncbi:unnamed protein product [Fusarium equiseti]|uniref:G-protein coupled receptors family 1 profile domain-containing protein n=1 Tax=Fusarium equiseti TaxID=61235 RepID=A0A8J2NFW7_FUSEQ|nr:unnamed protein product [Fusarium equiseti]